MFINRFKLFNLLGFPIYIDLSWFLIVLLITWSLATNLFPHFYEGLSRATYWWMGLAGALGLFVSILAHELGHSVVARRFNMPMRGITLFLFGGVAEMSNEPPSPKAEFFVAIAGPIVSVLIALGCYAIADYGKPTIPPAIDGVIWYLALINGLLVMFNLIPAFPLDGGRVLRSILWHFKGNLRWATRITANLGSLFGLVLIVFGVLGIISGNFVGGLWECLLGIFLRGAAQMSYQQVLIRRVLEGTPVAQFMRSDPITVDPSMTVQHLVDDFIYRYHHKMYPVVDGNQLLGYVTTRQVQQVPREEWDMRYVHEIQQPCTEENTITPDVEALQAFGMMNRNRQSRVIVADEGQLVGILALKDLMEFISLKVELEEEEEPAISPSVAP